MNEELYRTSLAKYPFDRLPWLHSEVEPLQRFDIPRYRKLPEKPRQNDWLHGHIRKALAGCRYAKPSADEFCWWFRTNAPLDEAQGYIVREVLSDLYRTGRMPLLWRFRDSCGASIYEIARTMGAARVSAWYPCLWINRYAWHSDIKATDVPTPHRPPTRNIGTG